MLSDELRDLTIIGAGPAGLLAACHAESADFGPDSSTESLTSAVRLRSPHSHKYTYDVAGFPRY